MSSEDIYKTYETGHRHNIDPPFKHGDELTAEGLIDGIRQVVARGVWVYGTAHSSCKVCGQYRAISLDCPHNHIACLYCGVVGAEGAQCGACGHTIESPNA